MGYKKSPLKIHFTQEETQFLIKNYPYTKSKKLSEIWFEKFNREIKPQAIKEKAYRLGIKAIDKKTKEIRICHYCGKEFIADTNRIYHNTQFCSRRCYADFLMRENERKLNIKPIQYKAIYKRDKSYIEDSFSEFARKNSVIYDDLIAFFWEHQFKYYVHFCIKTDKRVKLKRFLHYALLNYFRNKKKERKIINAYKDNLIINLYNDLSVSHKDTLIYV